MNDACSTDTDAALGINLLFKAIMATVGFIRHYHNISSFRKSLIGFLELHFDEIPVFICGFAYGPLAGFLAICLKTALNSVSNAGGSPDGS